MDANNAEFEKRMNEIVTDVGKLKESHADHAIKIVRLEEGQINHEKLCAVRYEQITNLMKSTKESFEKSMKNIEGKLESQSLPKVAASISVIIGIFYMIVKMYG